MSPARNVKALHQTARDCFRRHDYEQALSLIDAIPNDQRTDKVWQLLRDAEESQQRVDELVAKIEQLRNQPSKMNRLESSVRELLKLKPGWDEYRQLWREITTETDDEDAAVSGPRNSDVESEKPAVSIFEQFELPKIIAIVSVITSVVFGGFMLWLFSYLDDDRITITVEIDDPSAFVRIHGQEEELTNGDSLRLTPGKYRYEVHRQSGRLIGPLQFEVGDDHRRTLSILLKSGPATEAIVISSDGQGAGEEKTDGKGERLPQTPQEQLAFALLPPQLPGELIIRNASGGVQLVTDSVQLPRDEFDLIGFTLLEPVDLDVTFAKRFLETSLQNLDLHRAGTITDAYLNILSEIESLISLKIDENPVTREGLIDFLLARPDCTIQHELMNKLWENRRSVARVLLDQNATLTLRDSSGETVIRRPEYDELGIENFLIVEIDWSTDEHSAAIPAEILKQLSSLRELKHLNLNGRENVIATVLTNLPTWVHLKELQLARTSLADVHLGQILSLDTRMKWLNVTGSRVTPNAFHEFQNVRPEIRITPTSDSVVVHKLLSSNQTGWNVKLLFRDGSNTFLESDGDWPDQEFRLIVLDLTDYSDDLTDILNWAAGSYVEDVILTRSAVTDEALSALAESEYLKRIDLTETSVRQEAIRDLQKSLGRVKILK